MAGQRPRVARSCHARAVALLALALVLAAPSAARAQVVCGDADADGLVTDTDGVLVLRQAANLPSPCKLIRCDADGDDRITDADAVLVLRKAVGLPAAERCGRGGVRGVVVPPDLGQIVEAEREPNDSAGVAHVLAPMGPGATRQVRGALDPRADPLDGFVVPLDAAGGPDVLALDLRVAPASADLDLLVLDAGGRARTCESVAAGAETCAVEVAGAAVHVVVAAVPGSAPASYTLTMRRAADAAAPHAGDPIALAPAEYLGTAAAAVAGEIVAQAATRTGDRAAVADALATGGLDAAWEVVAADPAGGVLLAHRRAADAASAAAGAPAARAAAKRARADLRAATAAAAALLAESPSVAYAHPNYLARPARLPDDPLLGRQWHYGLIGLPDAWDLTVGADDVIVAVIDTGVRSDHPDLAGRLVPGFDFISSRERANDGDGIDPDPFDPGDLPGSILGGSFHGTHVAGTIAAATDNARGVAGVTWRTRVMPLRVLGVGGGSTYDIAQAIRFAAGLPSDAGRLPAAPAAVINLSLFAFGENPFMRAAVDDATAAGALVVAAAGNTGSDVVVSPAVFANSLAVGATDVLGQVTAYSARGPAIDCAAPGGDTSADLNADGEADGVLSTLVPGAADFVGYQGTSMAAAHVSGVAALLLAAGGGAAPAALRAALLATADDRGLPGRDDLYGFGMIDSAAAVRAFAGLPMPAAPVLALDATTLGFGTTRVALGVHARNAGGGMLALAAPRATTADGLGWLAASLEPATIVVRVERAFLLSGAYAGRVEVDSSGGSASLAVHMTVAPRPPVDVGPVTVQVREPGGTAPVAATTTTFARGYAYELAGVRGGLYELRAGTDRDGDGTICEAGDLCGAFPVAGAPVPVRVVGGMVAADRDFVLGRVTMEP